MATVVTTFNALDTAAKTWAAVADIDRWVLALPDAQKKGWGDRWTLAAPQPGPAAPVRMLLGPEGRVVQTWEIEEWQPGRRLALRLKEQTLPVWKMSAFFEMTLTEVSPRETRVDAALTARFSDLGWSLVLNLIAPVKTDIGRVLGHWEKGVLDVLAGVPK